MKFYAKLSRNTQHLSDLNLYFSKFSYALKDNRLKRSRKKESGDSYLTELNVCFSICY